MCGSRNFRQGGQGGPGQSDKKALTFFFVLFLLFWRGSNIFQGGGVQLFPGGGQIAYSL